MTTKKLEIEAELLREHGATVVTHETRASYGWASRLEVVDDLLEAFFPIEP